MRVLSALIAVALSVSAAYAVPGVRDRLNACKAMVEHAGAAPAAGAGASQSAELQKCREIIKEWTLRDSRMSVDESGKPMK
jgi:hypothetical protein